MGLHKKISLVFAGVLVVFAIGSYLGLSSTLTPAFEELEGRAAKENLERARNGIASYLYALGSATASWAHWDSARDFVLGNDPGFVAENLEKDSLLNLGVNVMAYYDVSGKMHWGMFVDMNSGETLPLGETVIPGTSMDLLRQHESGKSVHRGLVGSALGPMLVYSWPIIRSDRSGPVAGALIVAKLLDDRQVLALRELAEVDVDVRNLSLSEFEDLQDSDNIEMFGQVTTRSTPEERTQYQVLHDIHGEPVAIMTVHHPREISRLGHSTTQSVLYLFAILGTVVVLGLALILRVMVVRPISTLRAAMVEIQNGGELSQRVKLQRSDEIGDLAASFDSMLDKLDELNHQHTDQSFKAGMAEVAAGVLHNVRNSLMPIMNNISMARESAANSSSDKVGRTIEELRSGTAAADRTNKLLEYLGMAHLRLNEERATTSHSLELAMSQLNDTTDMLREQEKFTHARPVVEKVNLGEVTLAARPDIPADSEVVIAIDSEVGNIDVLAHRVGLLQVLSNIYANAVESIERSSTSSGRIDISATTLDTAGHKEAHLLVRDNGAGITAEELEHVFDRGFTTKDTNRGLGLHWSANALSGMEGRISARSDGQDSGAEIIITLRAA